MSKAHICLYREWRNVKTKGQINFLTSQNVGKLIRRIADSSSKVCETESIQSHIQTTLL